MKKGFINISLKKLKDNFNYYKNNTNKKIIAVIKDNAYGHGLVECAKALQEEGCDYFVVSMIEEALLLRENGIKGGILLLGYPEKHEYKLLSLNNISIALYSWIQLFEITNSYFTNPLKLHLKINSGMQRNGITPSQLNDVLTTIKNDQRLILEGVFTHYLGGKNCFNFVNEQFYNFKSIISEYIDENLMIHASSTNTYNLIDEDLTNCVRIGLGLYGLSDYLENHVITLKAPIVQVYKAKVGTVVGYDALFKCNEDGYVYTLPIGYADGYKPILNHNAFIDDYLIQAGKVSMDYSNFFSTKYYMIGEEVELIGEKISVGDIAKKTNTSKYDIVSSLSIKLKRNYIKWRRKRGCKKVL